MEVTISTLEEFTKKMTRSGYSRRQMREIMEAGVKGYHNKLRRNMVHRNVTKIQDNRELRLILAKSTWYLPKTREEDLGPSITHRGGGKGRRKEGSDVKQKGRNPFAPVAPIFVPRTKEGSLVNKLREVEERLGKLGPKNMPKLKLVEEGG